VFPPHPKSLKRLETALCRWSAIQQTIGKANFGQAIEVISTRRRYRNVIFLSYLGLDKNI
jgi:hypothetical protein